MMQVKINDPEYIAAHRELCRRSFRAFIRAVDKRYVFNWHHLLLIDALERLRAREFRRLVVMMPPRHGKSTLVSVLFPAWCMGVDGDEQVIEASYTFDLASKMNRECHRVMTSPEYKEIFPGSRLGGKRDDSSVNNSRKFDIVGKRGYYLCSGVGGGITGEGATIGIIDDPVKDEADADSSTMRNKVWGWYQSTFKTRFEPTAIEVICQTRWHEDDLTGRVLSMLSKGHSDTVVIKLPAICVDASEANRKVGDALWEGKYPRSVLMKKCDPGSEEFVGSRTWNALYQQEPAPDEGGSIKRSWFDTYDIRTLDTTGLAVNFYFDTAYTKDESNDPCAGIAYVVDGGDFYVIEAFAKWLDFPDQIREVRSFVAKNGYSSRSIIRVEPKATGKSLVQVLRKATSLNIVEGLNPGESKMARVNSCSAILEAKRVLVPEGMSWVGPFLDECATFPNAAHDDMVDCLTGMILNETGQKPRYKRKIKTV